MECRLHSKHYILIKQQLLIVFINHRFLTKSLNLSINLVCSCWSLPSVSPKYYELLEEAKRPTVLPRSNSKTNSREFEEQMRCSTNIVESDAGSTKNVASVVDNAVSKKDVDNFNIDIIFINGKLQQMVAGLMVNRLNNQFKI